MAKYHIASDGTAKPCTAQVACPLGDSTAHGEFTSPEEARVWAEAETAKVYSTFGTANRAERFEQARADLDRHHEARNKLEAEIDAAFAAGASQYDEAMLKKFIEYHSYSRDIEAAGFAVKESSSTFTRLRNKVNVQPYMPRFENLKQHIAELEEALAIRQDLDSMDETNRKWAMRRIQEILPPEEGVSNEFKRPVAEPAASPAQMADGAAIYAARVDRRVKSALEGSSNEHWSVVPTAEVDATLTALTAKLDRDNVARVRQVLDDVSAAGKGDITGKHREAVSRWELQSSPERMEVSAAAQYDARISRRTQAALAGETDAHWEVVPNREIEDTLSALTANVTKENYAQINQVIQDVWDADKPEIADKYSTILRERARHLQG